MLEKIMYAGFACIVLALVLHFTGVIENNVYYCILAVGIVLDLIVYFVHLKQQSDE